MSYTFKYNRKTGTYEVMKHNKVVKECNTKDEVVQYIGEQKPDKSVSPPKKKKIIGFGDWVPNFILKEAVKKDTTENI